ncbi:TPA_asm: integrase [Synchytrium chytrid fungus MELD element]|nr:TPA_asm: integrase [Synchytrium chytrid fungus MELD element]
MYFKMGAKMLGHQRRRGFLMAIHLSCPSICKNPSLANHLIMDNPAFFHFVVFFLELLLSQENNIKNCVCKNKFDPCLGVLFFQLSTTQMETTQRILRETVQGRPVVISADIENWNRLLLPHIRRRQRLRPDQWSAEMDRLIPDDNRADIWMTWSAASIFQNWRAVVQPQLLNWAQAMPLQTKKPLLALYRQVHAHYPFYAPQALALLVRLFIHREVAEALQTVYYALETGFKHANALCDEVRNSDILAIAPVFVDIDKVQQWLNRQPVTQIHRMNPTSLKKPKYLLKIQTVAPHACWYIDTAFLMSKNDEQGQSVSFVEDGVTAESLRQELAAARDRNDRRRMQDLEEDLEALRLMQSCIFVCIDGFSRYLWVRVIQGPPTADTSRAALQSILNEVFPSDMMESRRSAAPPSHGPQAIRVDAGREFQGSFKQFVEQLAVHPPLRIDGLALRTQLYVAETADHRSQAIVERVIRTIKTKFYRYITVNYPTRQEVMALARRPHDWHAILNTIVTNLNATKHTATGQTPTARLQLSGAALEEAGAKAFWENAEGLAQFMSIAPREIRAIDGDIVVKRPGDCVRYRLPENTFKKGTTPRFSKDVCRVVRTKGYRYILAKEDNLTAWDRLINNAVERERYEVDFGSGHPHKFAYHDLLKVDCAVSNNQRPSAKSRDLNAALQSAPTDFVIHRPAADQPGLPPPRSFRIHDRIDVDADHALRQISIAKLPDGMRLNPREVLKNGVFAYSADFNPDNRERVKRINSNVSAATLEKIFQRGTFIQSAFRDNYDGKFKFKMAVLPDYAYEPAGLEWDLTVFEIQNPVECIIGYYRIALADGDAAKTVKKPIRYKRDSYELDLFRWILQELNQGGFYESVITYQQYRNRQRVFLDENLPVGEDPQVVKAPPPPPPFTPSQPMLSLRT